METIGELLGVLAVTYLLTWAIFSLLTGVFKQGKTTNTLVLSIFITFLIEMILSRMAVFVLSLVSLPIAFLLFYKLKLKQIKQDAMKGKI